MNGIKKIDVSGRILEQSEDSVLFVFTTTARDFVESISRSEIDSIKVNKSNPALSMMYGVPLSFLKEKGMLDVRCDIGDYYPIR